MNWFRSRFWGYSSCNGSIWKRNKSLPVPSYLLRRDLSCHDIFCQMAKWEIPGKLRCFTFVHFVCSIFQATAASSYCSNCKDPEKNLMKINIFYSTLNEHKIEDRIDYAVKDGSLFNALGGCLSLWLGISFCNLFEILELLLDLVGNFINRMLGRVIGRATNPI